MNVSQPIAITMGCPVGIGPEIIVKFMAAGGAASGRYVVIGDAGVLARQVRVLGAALPVTPWLPGEAPAAGTIAVHDPRPAPLPATLAWGRPDAVTGTAMAAWIERACELARRGAVQAMVTCPIAKSALQAAGCRYPGHTEMLADLCGTTDYAMMMAGTSLRVVLVTIHQSLASVAAAIRRDAVAGLIERTARSLRLDFGIDSPRIAVAGLNPHAGEGGLFGREEIEEIAPAVAAFDHADLEVAGPLPPDTVFARAAAGAWDAVVCMYHDQGLIPFKLLHFKDGVNVTIGLPIVRTSVDHGTAYDIAGQGRADAASLAAACDLAGEIAANRRAGGGQ